MKMRKIISLFATVAILATSAVSVSAAISYTETDGYKLVDVSTLPANETLPLRNPKLSFAVEQLTTKDDVKNNATTAISNQWNLTTYDVYKVIATISNLGELVNSYDTNWGYAFTGIYNVTIPFSTTFDKLYINPAQLAGGSAAMAKDTVTGITNLTWTASNTTTSLFPAFDENNSSGEYMENGSMDLVFLTAVTKGGSIKHLINTTGVDIANLSYQRSADAEGNTQEIKGNTNITLPASLDLPPVVAPTEPTITEGTGKDVTDGVNGKVWNDVVIEDVALGTDYKAVFTYNKGEADEDTAEFAISGLEGDEVNGNATFAVILKTAKDVSKIVMDIICEVAGK